MQEQEALQSGSQLIHRLFPFERLIDLIRTNIITLVKPKLWEDPYENLLNRPFVDEITNKELGSARHFDNDLFAQCWSLLSESDAMWRIYSADKRAVLVSVNANFLFNTKKLNAPEPLEQLYIGKVCYLSEGELTKRFRSLPFMQEVMSSGMYSSGTAKTLLYKRDSFEHEKEVRLILVRHISEMEGDLANVHLDFSASVVKLTLDPRLTNEEIDRTSFVLRKIGYEGALEQSRLYAKPDLKLAIPNLMSLFDNVASGDS